MRPAQPARRARKSAGFTLLELMVSLTVGGIAISAMYTIGATLVKQYHQQHQAANAMTSLRVAMNQVKRDIARAGYMATPNLVPGLPHGAAGSQGCATNYAQHAPGVSGSLAGISVAADDVCATDANCVNVHADIADNRTRGFTADGIVLFGNYETSSEYPNVQFVSATSVSIGSAAHSYRTDFTRWHADAVGQTIPDENALARVFAPGRLVRIRTTGDRFHFSTIATITAPTGTADALVTLDTPIPGPCQAGVEGGWIAPVSAIRYFPRNDPNPPNPNPWGPMAQLVRREVEPGNKATPLSITEPSNTAYVYTNERVVLDYLVSFNLGFVTKAQDPAVGAPDPQYVPGNDVATFANVNTNPERVRAVTIELSARTPDDDVALAPATCANLRCFQITAGRQAAARVRTLRAEVFVPNIAFESY